MKKVTKLLQWGNAHHTNWFVLLRIALGILLFTKGIDFINNIVQFQQLLLQQKNVTLQASWLPFAIAWSHIFGGLFITGGLFTRAFCLIQLPIVAIALLVNISDGILTGFALFEIVSAFILLLMFLLQGGGPISLDRYFYVENHEEMAFGV